MIYTYNFFSLVDCQWNEWGSWESCPVTCGGGIQTRIRSKKVEEQFGGLECAGEDTESQTCGCDLCSHSLAPLSILFTYLTESVTFGSN